MNSLQKLAWRYWLLGMFTITTPLMAWVIVGLHKALWSACTVLFVQSVELPACMALYNFELLRTEEMQ